MDGERLIQIHAASGPPFARRPFEACEHKGVGHPDTLTDGACEAAAVALAQAHMATYGQVLHFNVDKGLLVAGRSEPRFGGGRMSEPMKLIICGRASNPDGKLDVDGIVTAAVTEHLKRSVRTAAEHFRIVPEVKGGSENLRQVYATSGRSPRANDTSFGVGYAPLSELEREVLDAAAVLRSDEFRHVFPAAGDDFKIMGVRSGAEQSLTIALAMIDRHLSGIRQYFDAKAAMHQHLTARFPRVASMAVNALDDPDASSEGGIYLTVSGLSAEMGDDGQVGRGNRVNGLITPGRPMSLEAAAGKNPVSHVGKLYNVLAPVIASAICTEMPEVVEASVLLVSKIGRPVDDPWITAVEVVPARQLSQSVKARIRALVGRKLDAANELTEQLVAGKVKVY